MSPKDTRILPCSDNQNLTVTFSWGSQAEQSDPCSEGQTAVESNNSEQKDDSEEPRRQDPKVAWRAIWRVIWPGVLQALTLLTAIFSAIAATSSSRAAQDAVAIQKEYTEITRAIFNSNSRPYVGVGDISVAKNDEGEMIVRLTIKNSGTVAATDFLVNRFVAVDGREDPVPDDMKDRATLLPGAQINLPLTIPSTQAKDFFSGSRKLQLRIAYSFTGPTDRFYEGSELEEFDARSGQFLQGPYVPRVAGRAKKVFYSGHEKDPNDLCGMSNNENLMHVILGGNDIGLALNSNPTTIIQLGGESVLSLRKEGQAVMLTAIFRNKDGEALAELRDNSFRKFGESNIVLEASGPHEIIVRRDQKLLLQVYFANEHRLIVNGLFRTANFPEVTVGENGVTFADESGKPGAPQHGNCFVGQGLKAFYDEEGEMTFAW